MTTQTNSIFGTILSKHVQFVQLNIDVVMQFKKIIRRY